MFTFDKKWQFIYLRNSGNQKIRIFCRYFLRQHRKFRNDDSNCDIILSKRVFGLLNKSDYVNIRGTDVLLQLEHKSHQLQLLDIESDTCSKREKGDINTD